MKLNNNIEILNGDCCELIKKLPDASVDAIITDPPYLYLKNQKLDKPFNEDVFFNEAKRVLKKSGFIVMFGRGTAFYRWNTQLADLGFTFKEEIIWNKRMTTSPVLPLNRVHETISIYCKGKGKINKCRVPYVEMKGHDIGAIKQDIKRLMSVFSNEKHLKAVKQYLEDAQVVYNENISSNNNYMTFSEETKGNDRNIRVMQSIKNGLKEKTIINNHSPQMVAKYNLTIAKQAKTGDRCAFIAKEIEEGHVEKSIITQTRDHYTMQHPTQKPVRLMERLVQLVTKEGDIVVDPFMGSGSTGIACINTGRKFIGYELDDEYFNIVKSRLENHLAAQRQDLFYAEAKGAVNE